MKADRRPSMVLLASALLALVVSACATRPAPDFRGSWKAVNRYAEAPEEIPLQKAYLYQPSPMDGTLKNMLTRWAKDSQMTLVYRHPSDFTLYAPVEQISTYYLNQAASLLTSIYAEQQVSVSVQGKQIVVTQSISSTASPAAAVSPPAVDPNSLGNRRVPRAGEPLESLSKTGAGTTPMMASP